MKKTFHFNTVKQYSTYTININKTDYLKLENCIYNLNKKYDDRISNRKKLTWKTLILINKENL